MPDELKIGDAVFITGIYANRVGVVVGAPPPDAPPGAHIYDVKILSGYGTGTIKSYHRVWLKKAPDLFSIAASAEDLD